MNLRRVMPHLDVPHSSDSRREADIAGSVPLFATSDGDPGLEQDGIDLGGTIRAADLSATLHRARAVGRRVGISRIANVTGLDVVGVPVWAAVRPLARSLTVSQGKGLTDGLAQASAMMESIEVHHAEHFVPHGHLASLRETADDERYVKAFLLPVQPKVVIHPDVRVEWIEGKDLTSRNQMRVTRDCIDLDTVAQRTAQSIFVASSNGLASGNTTQEAILHATCEVIERDQESLWYARKYLTDESLRTRLCLDSVSDEHCRWLLEKCRASGLRVAAWYATQDIPVPCFVCNVFDSRRHTFYPQRAAGIGCHPYRRIALFRAISEALQSRLTHIAGARDDVYWSDYRNSIPVDGAAGIEWVGDLDGETENVSFDCVAQAPSLRGIPELLDWVLGALSADGFSNVVVVDLTQPELAIPVVHVTVPGLEGMIRKDGYTPGPRMQRVLERTLLS